MRPCFACLSPVVMLLWIVSLCPNVTLYDLIIGATSSLTSQTGSGSPLECYTRNTWATAQVPSPASRSAGTDHLMSSEHRMFMAASSVTRYLNTYGSATRSTCLPAGGESAVDGRTGASAAKRAASKPGARRSLLSAGRTPSCLPSSLPSQNPGQLRAHSTSQSRTTATPHRTHPSHRAGRRWSRPRRRPHAPPRCRWRPPARAAWR